MYGAIYHVIFHEYDAYFYVVDCNMDDILGAQLAILLLS